MGGSRKSTLGCHYFHLLLIANGSSIFHEFMRKYFDQNNQFCLIKPLQNDPIITGVYVNLL